MDSKIVTKRLNEAIRPLLREHGFSTFTSRTSWRYRPNRIEIINFQSFNSYLAESLGCTTYSFCINQASAMPAYADYMTRSSKLVWPRPQEYEADYRRQLKKVFAQPEFPREDIWYVDPAGDNLPQVVRDATTTINREAWPWFDRWADDRWVLQTLKTCAEAKIDDTWGFGSLPSPARTDKIALLEYRLEQGN